MLELGVVWKFTIDWIVLKFRAQTKKPQDKQDSKVTYSVNGSWYTNKTNTFSPFKEESIGSIQFNGEISMMLPTKFVWILTPWHLTIDSLKEDIFFNINYIFNSHSVFFSLDFKIAISVFETEWNFCICLFSFLLAILRHKKLVLCLMEWVTVCYG